jgi:ubiquinone/menaquinone biosynthesis C-methylase UbiE
MPDTASALSQPVTAFDALARSYDDVFTESCIGRAQRSSVWREMDRHFLPGQSILEINCGTGVDALYMAKRGVRVVACDASREMIAAARRRLAKSGFEKSVQFHSLPTEDLGQLEEVPLFDGALSNFAGLNCVQDLPAVGSNIARLLRPGAVLMICVFGRWCLWEVFWFLARGNPHKAFRRLGSNRTSAHLKGYEVDLHYSSVREWKRAFAPFFKLEIWKGVGVTVPPSYLEPLAIRYRRSFRAAISADRGLERNPVARCFGDHLLLTFRRVED